MAKSALQKFTSVAERCKVLVGMSRETEDMVRQDELLRMAVVLAVAGMDAYFTDKFSEILIPHLKKKKRPTKALCSFLEEAGFTVEVAIEMLQMQRPHRRIRTLVDTYLEKQTTQRADAIDKLFLGFGLKNFCEAARAKAKRKNLLKRIAKLVGRRHEIVHEADMNARGTPQAMRLRQVENQLQDLEKFVLAADAIASNLVA